MDVINESYKALYDELVKLGISDEKEIEKLIELINSFSNLLIDIYLEQKSEKRNNILQSIDNGSS